MLAALALLAAVPASASATAALTYPANGQTVTLNAQGTFTYAWTMTADDVNPVVWEGDSPTYDYNTFEQVCDTLDANATSCTPTPPLAAGTHYVTVQTTSQADNSNPMSPMTSFVVPPFLGWGCGFDAEDCPDPTGIFSAYRRHPQGDQPYSIIGAAGWINTAKGRISFSFTIRHGARTLAHLTASGAASGGTDNAGVRLYHQQVLWGDVNSNHSRGWTPLATGTRLQVQIAMSSAGHTLTGTTTLTQPPR
jgi:hypothetical protein